MKTKSKKQTKQGISLIVLVITIIVMIILAAAVIVSLSSNGIIDRANEAVDKTDEAQVKAYAQMIWADAFLDGKRGEELIKVVETKLKEIDVTPKTYTFYISDSGMEIQKFDIADWEFAYTYDQDEQRWSEKLFATSNPQLDEEIVVKFYNLGGADIVPPSFKFNEIPFSFNPGKAYKMVIEGKGDMGAVMTTNGSDMAGANAWQLDTLAFIESVPDVVPEIAYVIEAIIDEGITNIGEYVFCGASSLKKITISESVQSIGDGAFMFSKSLTNIPMPEGVINIGKNTFDRCENLTNITIPKGITNIDIATFANCTKLTNVIIPEGVTQIGLLAFNRCENLTNVTIGDGITIGDSAFYGCTNLTDVTIGNDANIVTHAFYGCENLTNLVIGDNASILSTFSWYKKLTNVTIGDNASINNNAFSNCTNLTNVTIGDDAIIGNAAFDECMNLANVTIGAGANVGMYVFRDCTNIRTVYYTGTETEWNQMTIGSGNEHFINATKVYNYTPNN